MAIKIPVFTPGPCSEDWSYWTGKEHCSYTDCDKHQIGCSSKPKFWMISWTKLIKKKLCLNHAMHLMSHHNWKVFEPGKACRRFK